MMNAAKQRQLLDGQSSVARKVFESVPIQDPWTEGEIITALRAGTVSIAAHAIRACLYALIDAGVVKEVRKGYFQRVPVTAKKEREAKTSEQPPASEASMKNATLSLPTPPAAPALTPLEVLGTIAAELNEVSVEFGARMKALSERLDDVALLVEAQREADAEKMAKATQFRTLLKEMAGDL